MGSLQSGVAPPFTETQCYWDANTILSCYSLPPTKGESFPSGMYIFCDAELGRLDGKGKKKNPQKNLQRREESREDRVREAR